MSRSTRSAQFAQRGRLARVLVLGIAALTALPALMSVSSTAPPAGASAPAADSPPGTGMKGYRIYDLSGGAPDLRGMYATGISDDGVVSGDIVEADNSTTAFFWQPGAPFQTLDKDVSVNTWATAISPHGVIAGYNYEEHAGDTTSRAYGVEWRRADGDDFYGAMNRRWDLHQPDGEARGVAKVINSSGDILNGGSVVGADGSITPLSYSIPPEATQGGIGAHDMNEDGDVVGFVGYDPDGSAGPEQTTSRPTIWRGGSPSDLGNPPGNTGGNALAIDDDGDLAVLGSTHDSTTNGEAWLLSGGSWTDLGRFAPSDMNNDDQVVGRAASGAVVWNGEALLDLNTLLLPGSGWDLRDAVAINETGQIAGTGLFEGRQVAFLLDPIIPTVFVPGAAASSLVVGNDPAAPIGTELWLGCGESRQMLSLNPSEPHPVDVYAKDAMRYMNCGPADGHFIRDLDAYGTLLSKLVSEGGFTEYDFDLSPQRRTTAGCDLSQRDDMPNLFVFAYDWRKSNVEAAEQLADYVGCMRRFYPTGKINIVTHSMGSLVARRFIIDHPDEEVGRMITIGAPWLGAPKLVNALQTGEFAPAPVILSSETIKHILPWFPATHQLMAAEYYHDVSGTPVFLERGWNINGNSVSTEDYSYADMAALLDGQTVGATPAATAHAFQSYSSAQGQHQVDWSNDDTGVEYFHVVGVQSAFDTIGQVVATEGPSCWVGDSWFCSIEQNIEQHLVVGDGTVPLVSATRIGNGYNLNAPEATLLTVMTHSTGDDHASEHTGMAANPEVYRTIIGLLQGGVLPTDGQQGLAAAGLASAASATVGATPAGGPISTTLGIGEAAAQEAANTAALTSQRYVSFLGADAISVSNTAGATTAPIEGTDVRLSVPGVGTFIQGEHAGMVTLAESPSDTYTVAFTATDKPLQVELLDGSQDAPTMAQRWVDVALPEGAAATLTVAANGTEVLRYDGDGDGAPDTVVAPDVIVAGADALDVDAPQVSITAGDASGTPVYRVSATDQRSGVARVLWGTDGSTFQPYADPLELDPAVTPTVFAFAEDRAGNRSPLATFALADVMATPLTTATLTPASTETGWSPGAVTVALDATGSAGDGVASITYSAVGAQPVAETTVVGFAASLEIGTAGRTTVAFRATSAAGTSEPVQTVTVGVDLAAPAVALQTPANGAVVPALDVVAGAAGDDASGVASVEVRLTNDVGQSWNGSVWVDGETWLATSGTTTWSLHAGLPAGDALPTGAYRLWARARDSAGRTTLGEPAAITVAPDAGRRVHELPPQVATDNHTSAVAVNDRGEVVGVTGVNLAQVTRWADGGSTILPTSYAAAHAEGIALDGTVVGWASDSAGADAHRWTPGAEPVLLPHLNTDDPRSSAAAINDAGTVVVGASAGRPVRWDGDQVTELPALAAGAPGSASDVNDSGLVVGETQPAGSATVAVAWSGDRVTNLGTLGRPGQSMSAAAAVNDLGVAVGTSVDAGGRAHAVLFVDGEVRAIDAGLFMDSARALGVNNRGQAVGSYAHRDGTTRPFMWSEATGAVDLNELLPAGSGWVLQTALDVNELGQIVGFGFLHGFGRGYVLGTVHAPVAGDVAAETSAGQAVVIELDGWDPDVRDVLGVEIVGQPSAGTVEPLDELTVRYTPQRSARGVDSFTYRVTDGTFRSTIGTVTVGITGTVNQPPVAVIDAPATVSEGSDVVLGTAGSLDPDGTVLGVAWDLDGDGEYDDASGSDATVATTDDATLVVGVEVTDDGGATATATATVVVTNRAPVVAGMPAAATATAGVAVAFVGSVTDVAADTHTATIDYGDGSGSFPLPVEDGAFATTHTYPTTGTYTVSVAVTDDDGATATATTVVSVQPAAPVGGPGLVIGAGTIAVPGSGDRITITATALALNRTAVGAVSLTRSGGAPMSLVSVSVSAAGTWRAGVVRYATMTGTGWLKVPGSPSRRVAFDLTVADSATDRVWFDVRNADGSPVPELTLAGTPIADALPLRTGVMSVVVF